MASAKFLEEALSTDVDESAVNAIVGSLETQLVTSAPSASGQQAQPSQQNHHVISSGIANGATIGAAAAQPKPQKVANGSPPEVSKQQQLVNPTTSVPTTTTVVKTEPQQVKIIYPQVIAGSGVINASNKIAFPAQTVSQLANGAINIGGQTTSNVVQSNVATVVQSNSTTLVNKPAALVIKTSGAPSGMVSVPMSVPVSVAANAANTLQTKTCSTPTIVPNSVQILNVNAMRPATPVAGQQQNKQVAPRVVIGQHMVNTRPGTPGITLQTLHGLQTGGQGHLLLKTENGQYQLLRVGPPPATPGGSAVTPNSISGNTVVAAQAAGTTTYRLASVPAVSRLNTQFTGPPLATIRKPVQTVAVSATTATAATAATNVTAASTSAQPTAAATPQAQTQRPTTDNTKEKCRKFLANLLELSSREPKAVEKNVRTLIQELIDTKVEPEEFCDRLERLLHASPQPCLIGFLKKSLPLLRQSLVTKELVIEGIRPPPPNVVFSIATTVTTNTQNVVRPSIAATTSVPVVAGATATTQQVRVMAPLTTTTVHRPAQPVQQRMIRPGATTVVRSPLAYAVKTPVAVSGIRPSSTTVQKAPNTTVVKTITATAQGKTVNVATTLNKAVVPSSLPKPATKEKEKKTFSSAGYTGDDDINDVAAMGGVNLAEESQRILGSTEFVGTQIRSCKDEIFLHLTPLQQRIKQISSQHGLDEPSQEVASLISHAVQERLKNLVEKLAVIAEHRIDFNKADSRYEITQDVRSQLKFLEELDRVERKRHEEQERETLMRLAKSRAKTEDPEQAKLKAKAKEMQRAEMEELRQREANMTALQAIGPRKKPRLEQGGTSASGNGSGLSTNPVQNRQLAPRPRLKRVNLRDLLFLLEQEKEMCRSTLLYKLYLK